MGYALLSVVVQNTLMHRELELRAVKDPYQTMSSVGSDAVVLTNPRLAILFPIIHPFTNKYARYGWLDWSNVNDMNTSLYDGTFRSNVVTKNPTPAAESGRPEERSRCSQDEVSKPGKCHPSRSP